MEDKNVKIKNFIKGLIFGLLVVSFIFASIGCDKNKKGNGGNGGVDRYGDNYRNRFGTRGFNGFGIANVSAGLDTAGRYFIVLASAVESAGGFGYGPVYAEGELEVVTPMACGFGGGGLEPDLYQLYPLDGFPGQSNVELLTNIRLVAQGRFSEAIIEIPMARVFQTNVCGFDGMMGSMNVISVNGFNCGLYTTFSDQAVGGMCGF